MANIISEGVENERKINQLKAVIISKMIESEPADNRKTLSNVDILMIYLVLMWALPSLLGICAFNIVALSCCLNWAEHSGCHN